MSCKDHENIWKIMTAYTFKFEKDVTTESLKCSICDKLMIDACQSVCDCQYCFKCISEYLADGDRYCPGVKKECREEYLSLIHDVWRNMRKNKKIMKVIVKCPSKTCQTKIELQEMVNHLKECRGQPSFCPYVIIGCSDGGSSNHSVLDHLQMETFAHARLITQWIDNIKIANDKLNEIFEKSQLKFSALEKDSELKGIQIEEQRKEIDYVRKESRNKEKIFELELVEIRNEIETRLSTFVQGNEKKRGSVSGRGNEKMTVGRRNNNNYENLVDNLRKEVDEMKKERQDLTEQIDKLNKKVNRIRKDEERGKNNEALLLEENVYMDYVWRIYDLNRKIELMPWSPIFSESFYSNDYKLCLRIYVDGDNIGLYCFIMKGENDDNLQWPMKKAVTLSIVNQNNLRSYKSASFQLKYYGRDKSAFDRPKTEMNHYCIGAYPFMLYSEIADKPSIIVNDSVVVSCVLSDQ